MSALTQRWNVLRATLNLTVEGVGITGKHPTVSLYRLFDGKYLDSYNAWGTVPTELPMAEPDPTNLPGFYTYAFPSDPLDTVTGGYGYLFAIKETTTNTLIYEPISVLLPSPWDEDRTEHQNLGTFGHDLALSSLLAPGAAGDAVITILDQSSNPVEGALVRVYDSVGSSLVSIGHTDSGGRVVFGLPAGTYKVRVAKSGTDFSSANPTTIQVSYNVAVVPQVDYVIPNTAAAGDAIFLSGRYFLAFGVQAVFNGSVFVDIPIENIQPDGLVALTQIPDGLEGTVVTVALRKPDLSNSGEYLTSNVARLTLAG